jgi:hypothetical protein
MKKGWLARLAILVALLAPSLWIGSAWAQAPSVDSWTVNLGASTTVAGVSADNDDVLGVAPSASDAWVAGEDLVDLPQNLGNFLALGFYHSPAEAGWAGHGGYYRQDLRAPITPGQTKVWDTRIRTNLGTTDAPASITLSWGSLNALPAELSFTLQEMDASGATVLSQTDMRAQPSFTFQVAANGTVIAKIFQVVVSNVQPGIPVKILAGPTVVPTSTGATISWTTDVPATSEVAWGLTPALGQTAGSATVAETTHAVTLTGLAPSTTYNYKVVSRAPGLAPASSSVLTFTTLAPPPISITAGPTVTTTKTGATIAWTTDVACLGAVSYGPTDKYGTTVTEDTPGTDHSIVLANLTEDTLYHYQITATAAGFTPLATADATFRTLGPVNFTQAPSVGDYTGTSVTVSFQTNVPTTAVVEYGTTDQYGSQVSVTEAATDHKVALTGLTPGTIYHYRVSVTAGTTTIQSADALFATLSKIGITIAPKVVDVTKSSAVIYFVTDTEATGTVEYGPTTNYGSSASDTAPVRQHRIPLTGLAADTLYHFRVTVSADGYESSTTADVTFRTLPIAVPGDVNGDGIVTEDDARTLLTWAVMLALGIPINATPLQLWAADVAPLGHPDGRITVADAVELLMASADLIQIPPKPNPPIHDQGGGGSM